MKKQLLCVITDDYTTPSGSRNTSYVVLDGEEVVSKGISSNPSWVKHDAGGYHTKEKFDTLYPNGWEVDFDF